MSMFITLSPFLALPYIITAVIQKVRGSSRIGFWTTLLAYIAVIVPLVALALDTVNALYQPLLPAAILANAVIVLVISVVILVLDWRKPERNLNHSYGLLGLGVAALLVVGSITTPLILSLIPGSTSSSAQTAGATDGNLQTVLTEQTGLSFEDIQKQMEGGTMLVSLIEAHGGSTEVVTNALAQAINQAVEAGMVPQQMLDRIGGDGAIAAAQIVNGDLPPQMAGRVLGTFTGQAAGGFGGARPGSQDGAAPNAPAVQSADTSAAQSEDRPARPENQATVNSEIAADQESRPANEAASPTPTIASTPTKIAPVVIVPTDLPTTIPATPTPEPATCPLVVNFNLNLRAEPNSDGELVTTIPFGSVVQTTGQNDSGWWQVSYGRQSGWVSGEYVTPGTGCESLPVLS